jgi:hypothetical protein
LQGVPRNQFGFDFSIDSIEVGGEVEEVASNECAYFTFVRTTTTHECKSIGFVRVWED